MSISSGKVPCTLVDIAFASSNVDSVVVALTDSETLVIIDVRDEDEVWHDGQIKGPVLHIPSERFCSLANAKDIIRDHDLLTKEIIAVHCHKSQQRGPYCARLLAAAASELEEESAKKM